LTGLAAANATATGLAELIELERQGVLTATAFRMDTVDLSYGQYEALCYAFGRVGDLSRFWIGDAINWGEQLIGPEYAQAIESTGLSPATLVSYAAVCRQIEESRRRAALSFSHHRAVATLDPDEQEQWLDRALAEGWTRRQLRAEMDAADRDLVDASADPGSVLAPTSTLIEAARAVLDEARAEGESWVVPDEPMARLRSAVGSDEGSENGG
jgi:hypothetical protein